MQRKADKMKKLAPMNNHPGGHKLLSSHAAESIHDGQEMSNVSGQNKMQKKSPESMTSMKAKPGKSAMRK